MDEVKHASSLVGQLLVATPGMTDERFEQCVIYVCAHSETGAMGLVINRFFGDIQFGELAEQLGLSVQGQSAQKRIHFGGPVESGRGFVLHSTDFMRSDTVQLNPDIALTGTIDILRAIAAGDGPRHAIFALGYAGWGPGQLDQELHTSGWLTVEGNPELIFECDNDQKWHRAFAALGVNPSALSPDLGHA